MAAINTNALLEVQELSFSASGQILIDSIDLTLESDGISVVMGPNGAGKSLFIRLLHGLLEADSGRILWHGNALSPAIRKTQAMVFQKPVLLRRSVAANIDFVLRGAGDTRLQQCQRVLEQADLLNQAAQPARRLSGGEQQRLALARALATEPEVLLLDEPTASLDPASTLEIERRLKQARDAGIKQILVTHDIGQARRLASDVMFLHRGSLLEHSDAEFFFNSPASPQASAYLDGELVL